MLAAFFFCAVSSRRLRRPPKSGGVGARLEILLIPKENGLPKPFVRRRTEDETADTRGFGVLPPYA
jgi:hypothetical protein